MDRLRGMRILLTGASSGVGLAAVERFAREGASLALVARGRTALREAAALGRRHGAVVHVFPADLTDRAAVADAVEAAARALGGLDVVVSNAGAVTFGHFLEVEPDDFDRALEVTFTGAVNVIRAALPHLRETCGTVVATSSIVARIPLPAFSSYCAAKHALRGFLNTLRIEEREQQTGVRVAMVSPGPVDTPIYARATSATGRQPATLPDAYVADEVAKALVDAVLKPRHDRIVGRQSQLITRLYETARPAAELGLVLTDRWLRTGAELSDAAAGALWNGNDDARTGDGHPGRRSGDVLSLGATWSAPPGGRGGSRRTSCAPCPRSARGPSGPHAGPPDPGGPAPR